MSTIQNDLSGQRFGKLVVSHQVEDHIQPNGTHITQWLCQCDCGSKPIIAKRYNLKNGITTHCGCLTRKKLPDDDVIIDLYINQHKTCKEICRMYKLSDKSIHGVSKILQGEVLHHIDLDKLNNDFSNLFLCEHKQHLVCHRSIENLIKPLLQLGVIYFNNGEYKISDKYLLNYND